MTTCKAVLEVSKHTNYKDKIIVKIITKPNYSYNSLSYGFFSIYGAINIIINNNLKFEEQFAYKHILNTSNYNSILSTFWNFNFKILRYVFIYLFIFKYLFLYLNICIFIYISSFQNQLLEIFFLRLFIYLYICLFFQS